MSGDFKPPVLGSRFDSGMCTSCMRQARCHRSAQRPLAVNVLGAEARPVGFDEEAANLVVFVFDFGPDDGDVGDGAGGDPHLLAVEDVFLARLSGAGAHAAGIGSEVRLGEAEAADLVALLHDRQPGLFLLVAAEGVNGIHRQRRLHADERTNAAVAALQFLHDQSVFDVRHPGAAIAFEAGAIEAQVGHGFDQFLGEAAGAVALLDDGDEVVFDELAGGVADQALVVGEQGVEFEEIDAPELDGHYISRFCFFAAFVAGNKRQAVRQETIEVNKGRRGSQTR